MAAMLKAILSVTMAMLVGLPAQSAARQKKPQTGVHRMVWRRDDGPAIHYAISFPRGYSGSSAVPLVLALHFAGNPTGAGYALLELLVDPALEELGAIIIAPDSLGGSWDTAENDRAVTDLLDAAIDNYNIDIKKVVVTGFSMGGRGTWYFGSKYPGRFSAAIPMAGVPPESAAGWRLPVLAIHS